MGITDQASTGTSEKTGQNTRVSESAQFIGAGGRALVRAKRASRLDMMNVGLA
jgi:hypothetical protein